MPSALRSIAVFAFVSVIAVLSAPACSQQGEGQRCDNAANGNADCDDGLVCISRNKLKEDITDLCCHNDPANDSSSRCLRGVPGTNGGSGSGGSGGTSAGSSTGGASAGAAGEAAGGTAGTPGASGSPTTTDGGMSGAGGAPATTDGGAAGAGTGGQGGAG